MRNTGDLRVVPTPRGDMRVALNRAPGQTYGTALLFHGAGGDMNADVLVALRDSLISVGWNVARLDQPYRVAGRRVPDPAPHLDAVALQAVREVTEALPGPLVLGGKSSGARVACRVATEAGAVGVVALGFPLHPPGRPEKSRAPELLNAGVPVFVVQGSRDTFGTAADLREIHGDVHEVAGGDHSFVPRKADGRTKRECLDEVVGVVAAWVGERQAST